MAKTGEKNLWNILKPITTDALLHILTIYFNCFYIGKTDIYAYFCKIFAYKTKYRI